MENHLNIESKKGVPRVVILNLKKDSYCLKNSRITYSDRKKPLELTIFYYPPEKAKFEMILPRRDRNILLRVK